MKRILGLLLFLQTSFLEKAFANNCKKELVNICNCPTSQCQESACFTAWEYGKSVREFDSWPETCQVGKRQSPIDVKITMTQPSYNSYEVIFQDYTKPISCGQVSLQNTGRTAKFSRKKRKRPGFTLYDKYRGRKYDYEFHDGHFHWGSDDRKGSEHHINGRTFPLELHLVHFNKAFGPTLKEAVTANEPNSLSVLGIMFQLSDQPNEKLNPFFDALKQIRKEGDKINVLNEMGQFSLHNLLPQNTENFVQYFGSLTTPNCNEIVNWIIFRDTVYISREQMQLFRNLTFQTSNGERKLVDNYRPIQQLNGRLVF